MTSSYTPLTRANPTKLTRTPTAEAFSVRIAAEAPELDRSRAGLAGTLAEFSHANVIVNDADVSVENSTAEVQLDEVTRLYLAAHHRLGRGPEYSSYRLRHLIRFERSGGIWRLSSDVLDVPTHAHDVPLTYARPEKNGAPLPTETSRTPLPPSMVPNTPDAPRKPRAPEPLERDGGFNRQAAIDYALRWAHGRNREYNNYGNDCTNFLSQIFRAGGWANAGLYHEGPDKWWHYIGAMWQVHDNRTWRVAHDLAVFGYHYSKRTRSYAGEPARKGDAVYADWDNSNGGTQADGNIDHAMFITDVIDPWDWNGIYVTYHTTDRKNWPLGVTTANKPGSLYYFQDTR
ncbi:amidase domain-containing protein [Longimycelium tulufanense]|uniref:amidase domain-containing protein n=1 Tax=Longimycelium tulufanense TaxID=907463 RepID=UPI001667CFD8|nr:amidase domain-containing protein [Longimycelium tulufanense]